jgi:phospholipid-binding lipoprotein MlaA
MIAKQLKKIPFFIFSLLCLMSSVMAMTAVESTTPAATPATATPITAATPPTTPTTPTTPTDTSDAAAFDSAALDTGPVVLTQDPLESVNRAIFNFNDKVDTYFMKPVATGYNKIMPTPINEGIHNFFNNIGELPTIANDILQFNFYQMANDLWRFGVNTTIGIGGLFDVATRIKLQAYTTDFGLTMAKWGWEDSTYIVWPFFGPSTLRDGIGIPIDYFAFSIYPYIEPPSTRYQVFGLGVLDRRAQLLQYQSLMEEAAVDRYVFMRNAYLQRRHHLIEQSYHRSYNASEANEQPVPDLAPDQAQEPIAQAEQAAQAVPLEGEE